MSCPKPSVLEHNRNQGECEPSAPPAGVELPPAMRADLLDPTLWQDALATYARATHTAVALVDAAGRLIGECVNPQATWSLLHAKLPSALLPPPAEGASGGSACPFTLAPLKHRAACSCVADALATGGVVMARDRTGLVHFAVPLLLGDHPLGALVAGQVFDQYPEQLPLEQVAKQLGLSPTPVWHLARLEHPVKRATLEVYADLLATLGQTCLQTRYHTLIEAERLAEMTRLRDHAIAETTQRHRVEELQRFLAEVSAEFSSLNYETALTNLARRAVPFLADCCFFDVVTPDEKIQRVGWAHAAPAKQELFDEICRFVPAPHYKDHPVAKVLRSGTPILEPKVTDAWMQAAATSPEHLQLMRDLELRSLITVPLIAHERRLGALTFCYTAASGRHYTRRELRLAEEIARRAAMLVENAKLYLALQQADRRKSEFMAMLSHELRNPLACVLNAVHLLQRMGPDQPRRAQAQEIIERQTVHQARLLDDLMDVTRITHGKILLRPERLDLARLVRDTAEDCRSTLEEAGLTLTVELSGQPVWVEGDPTRLSQVLGNLCQNAANFTDRGGQVGVRLSVEARPGVTTETRRHGERRDEKDDPLQDSELASAAFSSLPFSVSPCLCGEKAFAVLTVRDTGIGIEGGMLPRVFEAFAQADRSLERSRGGLGLGLALVKGLVELHHGEVPADSAGVGSGTEFTIRLPLAPAPRAAEKVPAPVAAPAGPLRVLIVEDNRDAAETLRDLLALSGHAVEVAYTGISGVAVAQQFQPHVVLCDLGLPGLDGYQVAAELRRNPTTANARLIALSGYGLEEDLRRSVEAGFNLHLTKPVDFMELERLVAAGPEVWPA